MRNEEFIFVSLICATNAINYCYYFSIFGTLICVNVNFTYIDLEACIISCNSLRPLQSIITCRKPTNYDDLFN